LLIIIVSFSDKIRLSLRQSVAELNIEYRTCLQQAGKEGGRMKLVFFAALFFCRCRWRPWIMQKKTRRFHVSPSDERWNVGFEEDFL